LIATDEGYFTYEGEGKCELTSGGGKLTERGCFDDNIKNDVKTVGLEGVGWTDLA
jgi:hypothetical protein